MARRSQSHTGFLGPDNDGGASGKPVSAQAPVVSSTPTIDFLSVGKTLTGVGGALSFFSTLSSGKKQAALMREQAAFSDFSANRILDINDFNTDRTRDQSRFTQGAHTTKSVSSGFTSDLDALNEIARDAEREIRINTEEAQFRAEQLRLNARQSRRNARNTISASRIKAFTGALGTSAALMGVG